MVADKKIVTFFSVRLHTEDAPETRSNETVFSARGTNLQAMSNTLVAAAGNAGFDTESLKEAGYEDSLAKLIEHVGSTKGEKVWLVLGILEG